MRLIQLSAARSNYPQRILIPLNEIGPQISDLFSNGTKALAPTGRTQTLTPATFLLFFCPVPARSCRLRIGVEFLLAVNNFRIKVLKHRRPDIVRFATALAAGRLFGGSLDRVHLQGAGKCLRRWSRPLNDALGPRGCRRPYFLSISAWVRARSRVVSTLTAVATKRSPPGRKWPTLDRRFTAALPPHGAPWFAGRGGWAWARQAPTRDPPSVREPSPFRRENCSADKFRRRRQTR